MTDGMTHMQGFREGNIRPDPGLESVRKATIIQLRSRRWKCMGVLQMDGYERAFRVNNEPDRSVPYSHAYEERSQRTVVTRVVKTNGKHHQLTLLNIQIFLGKYIFTTDQAG